MNAVKPYLIMAGGTGGHVFPGLAVAQVLQSQGEHIVWLGSRAGMESKLIPERGITFEALDVSGLRGKGILKLLLAPFSLLRSIWQGAKIMRRYQPACVLSFGGFAAGPGGIAAWLLGKPLLVHEQNRIAGLTNRWLAKVAKQTLLGFSGALPNARYVGNPVRADISAIAPPEQRFSDRTGPLQLLVMGGSLGARVLNEVVPKALALMPMAARPLVRHQCGQRWHDETLKNYSDAKVSAEVSPFIADMAGAYANADVVLCRAGALTIAEVVAAGLFPIFIPYPHAVDDHQSANARWLCEAGAAVLLPESEASPERLQHILAGLNRPALLDAANRNRSLAHPNCAANIAASARALAAGSRS